MVLNEFKPHDVSRDVNSVFVSFLRSRGAAGSAAWSKTPTASRTSTTWVDYGFPGKRGGHPIGLPVGRSPFQALAPPQTQAREDYHRPTADTANGHRKDS